MKKKSISTSEAGRRGGRSTARKYGKAQMKKWGKLGGRPKKEAGK